MCPDKPLIVWHRSFHELYANTKVLEQIEYEDLEAIKAHPQIDWDNGHFYEEVQQQIKH